MFLSMMGKQCETHQREHHTIVLNEMFGVCAGREGSGAGAVDEEDFIQGFEDVPTVQVGRLLDSRACVDFRCLISSFICFFRQIYSNREVEEAMTKIRDVLSDDKRDWELRVAAVSRPELPVTRVALEICVCSTFFLLSS